jgi:quinol monooxygenase YgiN
MTTEIAWYVELAVKPGQLANFEKLTGEMVSATHAETGVLAYQRFISNDNCVVIVYERYANSEAAAAHLRKFAVEFGERYARVVDRTSFVVLGNPSAELRGLLDAYAARYFAPFGPFAWWSE